jgi:DNA-binding XRE family transcriptional regulator
LEGLRKRAGKPRHVVAADVGVSGERVVYAWERQGVIPDTEHVLSLARSLKASLREVYESLGFDLSGIPLDSEHKTPERVAIAQALVSPTE